MPYVCTYSVCVCVFKAKQGCNTYRLKNTDGFVLKVSQDDSSLWVRWPSLKPTRGMTLGHEVSGMIQLTLSQ